MRRSKSGEDQRECGYERGNERDGDDGEQDRSTRSSYRDVNGWKGCRVRNVI